MNKYLVLLRARGMQRGVLGSNRAWLGVWIGLTVVKFIGRMIQQPGAVDRVELRPGQAVEIRDTGVKWADVQRAEKTRTRNRKRNRKRDET